MCKWRLLEQYFPSEIQGAFSAIKKNSRAASSEESHAIRIKLLVRSWQHAGQMSGLGALEEEDGKGAQDPATSTSRGGRALLILSAEG